MKRETTHVGKRVALGKDLQSLRISKGLAKADIVRRGAFLSYRYVDNVEKGNANYSVDTLLRYLDAIEEDFSIKKGVDS